VTDELDFVSRLAGRFGQPPPGETWIGDDAAVVRPPAGPLLLAIDPMIQDVHFVLPDAATGWKAVARNVSDLAAMGGRPLHALVSLVIPPGADLSGILDGLEQATAMCPIVGGDTASGPVLIITVAVTGTVDGIPVLRSGARPGDVLFVTGPLGGVPTRPTPRVPEGTAARLAGATAMIDISDGLALDLRRLADDSGVGFQLEAVPVVDGIDLQEAVTWGDDYELVFAAPDPDAVFDAFAAAGLHPPIPMGRCTARKGEHLLGDRPLPEGGWEHSW
jgi:thiamine-monophosphate kinase